MRVVPSDRGVSPWEGAEGPSVTAARYVDLNPVPWVLRRAWSQVARFFVQHLWVRDPEI